MIRPKVELHCHLDGILDPAMARAILQEDPSYPVDPETLARLYPVDCFARFEQYFTLAAAEGSLDNFRPVLVRYLERLKAERVVYLEVMIGGSEIPLDPGAAVEKVGAFRQWLNEQEAGAIQVEFLACFARMQDAEKIAARSGRYIALREAGLLAGVAVAGPEAGYPVRPHARTLARLRDAGLGIEIHAGEWAGPESVWEAIESGCPDRIGHGVHLFADPALVERIQERGIHLEFCLTSNLKTGSIARLEDHPVRRARDLGLSFSINSDDPGAFDCTPGSESRLLAERFGFTEEDFAAIYRNSLAARFQPALRYPMPRAE
jgi:adenosine deaminase